MTKEIFTGYDRARNGDISALSVCRGNDQDYAVIGMLYGDAADHVQAVMEENRRLHDALHPHPSTRDTSPLILYFGSAAERTEFIDLFKQAKPGAQTYEVAPTWPVRVK